MLRPLSVGLVLALISAAPVFAQRKAESPAPSLSIENLENDHEFFEIEVTIAQWKATSDDKSLSEQQLKLEGAREEVATRISELQKAGLLTNVHRVRLMAPAKLSATVQVGADQPRVSGSQFAPRGGTVHSINYQSVGTVIRVVPRSLHENRIAVELDVSKSGLATAADAPVLSENESGRQIKADTMRNLTVRTIASVVSGQTVLVSGSQQPDEGEFVLLSAREVPR